MNIASDLGSPVAVQPHSLPTRFGADVFNDIMSSGVPFRPSGSRSRGGSVDHNIVSPVLSMSGVAQPMDIPVGKMRRASSRSSLDEASLGNSRGTSPSSFGSSFGSSPHNMFAFTPPFASGMSGAAAVASATSPPDAGSEPLVFSEDVRGVAATSSQSAKSTGASSFKAFAETSLGSPGPEPSIGAPQFPETGAGSFADEQSAPAQTSTMFGQFSTEDLPFADPAGPEDNDSKIGSFVEECWNAPTLSMFSGGNGQRLSQSTKALVDALAQLQPTKERLVAAK